MQTCFSEVFIQYKYRNLNFTIKMAEAQRFELWDPCESAVFKTAALNHSATLP